jgi:hypothetical protein
MAKLVLEARQGKLKDTEEVNEFNPHKNPQGQIGAMLAQGYLKKDKDGKIQWPDGNKVQTADGKNVNPSDIKAGKGKKSDKDNKDNKDTKPDRAQRNKDIKKEANSKECKNKLNGMLDKHGVKADDIDVETDEDGNITAKIKVSGENCEKLKNMKHKDMDFEDDGRGGGSLKYRGGKDDEDGDGESIGSMLGNIFKSIVGIIGKAVGAVAGAAGITASVNDPDDALKWEYVPKKVTESVSANEAVISSLMNKRKTTKAVNESVKMDGSHAKKVHNALAANNHMSCVAGISETRDGKVEIIFDAHNTGSVYAMKTVANFMSNLKRWKFDMDNNKHILWVDIQSL